MCDVDDDADGSDAVVMMLSSSNDVVTPGVLFRGRLSLNKNKKTRHLTRGIRNPNAKGLRGVHDSLYIRHTQRILK